MPAGDLIVKEVIYLNIIFFNPTILISGAKVSCTLSIDLTGSQLAGIVKMYSVTKQPHTMGTFIPPLAL